MLPLSRTLNGLAALVLLALPTSMAASQSLTATPFSEVSQGVTEAQPAGESGSVASGQSTPATRRGATQRPSAEPDYFFGRPHFTVTLRGGAFLPRARGQFYQDYAFDRFTLDRGDLTSFTGGVELGLWVGEQVEIFGSLDLAAVTRDSEYRDWEEPTPTGPIPITQTTHLRTGPTLGLGAKVYPLGRGDQLSQLIWIPARASPYLAAGIGGMGYEVEQWGDWVVEVGDNVGDIFTDEFSHADITFITFLGAGMDLSLRRSLSLTLDARYIRGEDRMTGDFRDFDRPLDLSGLRLTAGLSYRL